MTFRLDAEKELVEQFCVIRAALCKIEQVLGDRPHDDFVKEIDKSVCVMKVGAKVMKKQLSRMGHNRLGKIAKARV
jgi:hypothetical protein